MITQILAKVLPVLVMIALGRVCATKGILNDDQHAGLKNIIGDILLPVVLFQAFFTAEYGRRMLLVFVLVFAGYGAALAAGYGLRRFVKPYDRFMPLLMTSAEGGMLGYALYALLCGADQTKTYASEACHQGARRVERRGHRKRRRTGEAVCAERSRRRH